MLLRKSFIILALANLVVKTLLLAFMQPAGAILIAQSYCRLGSLYTVQSRDNLFSIARERLGNGNRWREITKIDGSIFTDAEVANLEPGQQVCIPGFNTVSIPRPYPNYPNPVYPNQNYPNPAYPYPTNPYPTYPTYPTNPYPTYPNQAYPYPTYPYPTNPYPTNPYPANPYPANPYPTYPNPTYPYPANPYPNYPNQNYGKGNFRQMLEALGAFESGRPSGDPYQYRVENQLGFMGKYQFGEALLIDLGYYTAGTYYGNGARKNFWRGSWTGKNGINSKEEFKNSPQVQEIAIREAFNLNWQRVNSRLAKQGQSVNDYLGRQKTFMDRGQSKTITISLSGILAGAHLRGPGGVADLLMNNQVSYDTNGTSILRYMDEYGGYNITQTDFSNLGYR
ncbi:MAG: LysM peptidoglycan-binding domain-containing protein [Scytonematopsis contorta HA4267-MV1]|jgi:hypothetical protein|nr:LysM peptidoglycan-binding domain-containing protein [Scytonematopsis contorta HA4267-MV1]